MGAPPMPRTLGQVLGRASGPSVDGFGQRLQRIGTASPPPKAVARVQKKIHKVWTDPTAADTGSLTITYNLTDILGGSVNTEWDITVSAIAGGTLTGTQDVTVLAVAGTSGNARDLFAASGVLPTTARASAYCIGGTSSSVTAQVSCTDTSGLDITLIMDASRR